MAATFSSRGEQRLLSLQRIAGVSVLSGGTGSGLQGAAARLAGKANAIHYQVAL